MGLVNSAKKHPWLYIDLLVIAIITFFLGWQGGLPWFHPDFVSEQVGLIFLDHGHNSFFHYPGLIIYLNLIAYLVILLVHGLTSLDPKILTEALMTNGLVSTNSDQVNFFIISHIITILFSVLGVIATYLTTYLLTKKRIFSILAAALLFSALGWVANSHFITVDIPLAALATTTICYLIYLVKKYFDPQKITRKELIILGILFGLTLADKYNGVLVALPIALVFLWKQPVKQWWRIIKTKAVWIILPTVILFIIFNPSMFTNLREFAGDIYRESSHFKIGHLGTYTDKGYLTNLSYSLFNSFGIKATLLGILGLIFFTFNRKLTILEKIAFLSFPVIYYLSFCLTKIGAERYMLPLLPFLAIAIAYLAASVVKYLKRFIHYYLALGIIVVALLLIIIPQLSQAQLHNNLLAKTDTRQMMIEIIKNLSLPDGLIINSGRYGGEIFAQLGLVDRKQLALDRKFIEADKADLLIYDSFSDDRYIHDKLGLEKLTPPPLPLVRDKDKLVLQLSPFYLTKEEVPYSPQSILSPSLPDLPYIKTPGPFIEIYGSEELISQLFNSCQNLEYPCLMLPKQEGYYYNNLP